MDVESAIRQRKSIRAFKPDPVPREMLRNILEQALRAPSWANTQPWEFFVVTGERLHEVQKAYLERGEQEPQSEIARPYEFPSPTCHAERVSRLRAWRQTPEYMEYRRVQNFKNYGAPGGDLPPRRPEHVPSIKRHQCLVGVRLRLDGAEHHAACDLLWARNHSPGAIGDISRYNQKGSGHTGVEAHRPGNSDRLSRLGEPGKPTIQSARVAGQHYQVVWLCIDRRGGHREKGALLHQGCRSLRPVH